MALIEKAFVVVTDTYNIQEESTYFHTLCITLSPNIIQPRAIADNSGFIDVREIAIILRRIEENKSEGGSSNTMVENEPKSSDPTVQIVLTFMKN